MKLEHSGTSLVTLITAILPIFAQPASSQRLICQGDAFVTQLVTTIFDRNREAIANSEPNRIGNRVENIGIFVLRHARAYNLSKARFHGLIKINCDGRRYPDTIIVKAAVEIPEPVFVFDYALPGELVKGKVIVTADSLGQIITLHVPSQVGSMERTLIYNLEFYTSTNFKITFTGLGPITRVLSSALWGTYRLVPQLPLQLYRALAIRTFQNYIDNNPLPL